MKSPSSLIKEQKGTNDSLIGKIFLKKYLLVKKLGEGSFGMIYLGVYNNERYALKFENRKQDDSLLETESYLLDYVKGPNIPYVKSYGYSNEYNILVMELLGKSLEDLMMSLPSKKFTLRTVCNIGIQMLTVINYIHDKHLIHRDIKPDNFVIGLKEKMNQIYIIDFGLAKKYRSSSTLIHYPMKNKKKLTGTARYASINALKGFEQSRRDDLESIGYVLVYLFKGSLPWQGLVIRNKDDRYQKIMEKKESLTPTELCTGLPGQFVDFIAYTRKLEYEENPNYEYLINLLKDVLKEQELEYDKYCDWFLHYKPSGSSNLLKMIETKDSNGNLNKSPSKNNQDKEQSKAAAGEIPQIKVEKTYMNQINNILIINTNNSNNNNNNQGCNNEGTKNHLEICQNKVFHQVPSNQAMNSSHGKEKGLNNSQNDDKSNKEIIPRSLNELKEVENNNFQSTPPLYQKSINIHSNPCSSCCIIV